MNRLMILVLLLAVQATAGGCALFSGTNPQITRRYASHAFVRDTSPSVSITVFALPIPEPTPDETGLTDLSPQAQAEMVKVMAERTKDGGAQDVVQALAIPIEGASSAPTLRNLTRRSRRLVFSLDNQSWGPANRISEARIYIRPRNGTRFVSWNRIENQYEKVEVGKLSLSQGRNVSAEVGLTLPILDAAPKLSGGAESTLTEDVVLSQQRAVLVGALTPDSAMLLQQGGAGIDLTGNVTADFEFVVPAADEDTTVFIPVLSEVDTDSTKCKQRPAFARQTFYYPRQIGQQPADVVFDVRLRYVLRDVPRGHRTILEGDDAALFRTGTASVDSAMVIPGEQLRLALFELRYGDRPLYIQGATQSGTALRQAPLQFGAFEDAVRMVRWMRKCKVPAVGHPIFVGRDGPALATGQEDSIHIGRVPLNYVDDRENIPQRPAMSTPSPATPNTSVAVGRDAY